MAAAAQNSAQSSAEDKALERVHRPERRTAPIGVFETVEGVRLHLADEGPRAAPAVVLIHGASGNLRDFRFGLAQILAQRYRLLSVDRPGFGFSERGPRDAHRPDVQARLIRQAAAQRGVRRAIVVGHSLGAVPALAWALDAPDSVLGVVDLAGVTHPWPGGVGFKYRLATRPAVARAIAGVARALATERRVDAEIRRIFRPQTPPEGYAVGVSALLALRNGTMLANAQDVANLHAFVSAQAPRYRALEVPVEILHGAEDRIVPASIHAEPLAAAAPNARIALLKGVGHMPHHAAPDLCVGAIDRLARRRV